jgi:hypothetical protein
MKGNHSDEINYFRKLLRDVFRPFGIFQLLAWNEEKL